MPVGSNMDMEETVENYFGDVVGKGPFQTSVEELENMAERYENDGVGEFLGVDDEIEYGAVLHDGDEAAYISQIDVKDGDIYMEIEEVTDEREMIHGLARKFVEYETPELGEWESEEVL